VEGDCSLCVGKPRTEEEWGKPAVVAVMAVMKARVGRLNVRI